MDIEFWIDNSVLILTLSRVLLASIISDKSGLILIVLLLFFSRCFQDILFLFFAQKFDSDVYKCTFLCISFILWITELLKSVNPSLSPDFGKFGHYFFKKYFALFSLSSTFGILISYVLNVLMLSHRSLRICWSLSILLCSSEWVIPFAWSSSSLTLSFVTSILLLSPTSGLLF